MLYFCIVNKMIIFIKEESTMNTNKTDIRGMMLSKIQSLIISILSQFYVQNFYSKILIQKEEIIIPQTTHYITSYHVTSLRLQDYYFILKAILLPAAQS